MSTPNPVLILPARLKPLAVLAGLLEKLERSPRQASAAQYRQVVMEIHHLLEELPTGTSLDKPLDRLLQAFPGTAEVFENMRYAESGLSRAPVDESISAETQAARIIEQARYRH
jgi:hypothetical protein